MKSQVCFCALWWDTLALIVVPSRGFEELQQEGLANLCSPALWNCRAVSLQSCIMQRLLLRNQWLMHLAENAEERVNRKYSLTKWSPLVTQVFLLFFTIRKTSNTMMALGFGLFECCFASYYSLCSSAAHLLWANSHSNSNNIFITIMTSCINATQSPQ